MANYFDDGHDGQVDGDDAPAGFTGSPFATAHGQVPWLRGGVPPWHMWGNSQQIALRLAAGQASEVTRGQLIKVSYARPDTFHWVMSAKLISGTPAPLGTTLGVLLFWELTTGIGRSIFQTLTFDAFQFRWEGASNAPVGNVLYATQSRSTVIVDNSAVPLAPDVRPVTEIVAQDIQLNVRAQLGIVAGALAGYPYDVNVEVTALFAPKTHIRPDWYRDGPPEIQFPGAEVEGR